VARQVYGLERLANDENSNVRAEVQRHLNSKSKHLLLATELG
jgi:hypothetical protein